MSDRDRWLRFGADFPSRFANDGFLIVHHFATAATCNDIRRRILDYSTTAPLTQVRWPQSTFDTFNSSQVDDNFPQLSELYDHHLLNEMQRLYETTLATVNDRRVGLSINLTNQGDKFQLHFDRHVMTAVLYVNDNYEGGEMIFYPRVRFWLGHPSGRMRLRLQRLLDRLVCKSLYLRFFSKKVTLKPQPGDLLIFEGARTYHAVTPVTGGGTRLSIQFAYDEPDIQYDTSNYYGK